MNLLSFARARRRRATALAVSVALASTVVALSAGVIGHDGAAAASNTSTAGSGGFDSGTGSWAAKSGTGVRRVSSPTQSGSGALALTNSTQKTAEIGAVSASKWADCLAPTPGNRYVVRGWIRAAGPSRLASLAVTFLNGQGGVTARAAGQLMADKNSGWRAPIAAAGFAPADAACVIVGVSFEGVPAGETHYVDSITVTSTSTHAAPVNGPLRVSGNKILDRNGYPVIFRGVNRPGLEGNEDGPPTDADISQAQAWGANFVRLPLGEHLWLSNNCYYDSTEMAKVDDAVRLITGKGMVAMLDLHWHTIGTCGRAGQWPMAEYAPAITFWKQVAARYQANPLVAFDLYNEPHNLSDDQWRNGGQITWQGTTYRTAGMQEMYDAVRSTGAQNLVMVTGNSWGNLWPKRTQPIAGSNVVYAIHAYTCPEVPTPQCTNKAPYNPRQFFDFWSTAEQKYPLMVTEFGWPNPNDGRYLYNVVSYAEAHGWSWSIYSWSQLWGPFSLLANNKPGTTWQPRLSAMAIVPFFPAT